MYTHIIMCICLCICETSVTVGLLHYVATWLPYGLLHATMTLRVTGYYKAVTLNLNLEGLDFRAEMA